MSSIKYFTLEEEMKKNPELKISDIQILREWCEKQPHLPKIQDEQLAIFLHSNYYQIEPTKNTIENYFTIRTHVPEFFSNRDLINMKELQESYKVVTVLRLEGKTKEGYTLTMSRFLDFNASRFVCNDATKCNFMTGDQFIWSEGSIPGVVHIADATGLTFGHLSRISLTAIKKFICYVQEALPIRLLAVHIINTSPIVDVLYNMVKPFLNAELVDLIHFHSSIETTSEYFLIDVLPNELGGKAGPLQKLTDAQVKKLENFREWYLEDERINRVNESLRIGKSKTSSGLFGVEGSFKKLEID